MSEHDRFTNKYLNEIAEMANAATAALLNPDVKRARKRIYTYETTGEAIKPADVGFRMRRRANG